MSSRTPGHWHAEYDSAIGGWTIIGDGWYVATCHTTVPSDALDEANARAICRAVNCHEELVAAGRAILAANDEQQMEAALLHLHRAMRLVESQP